MKQPCDTKDVQGALRKTGTHPAPHSTTPVKALQPPRSTRSATGGSNARMHHQHATGRRARRNDALANTNPQLRSPHPASRSSMGDPATGGDCTAQTAAHAQGAGASSDIAAPHRSSDLPLKRAGVSRSRHRSSKQACCRGASDPYAPFPAQAGTNARARFQQRAERPAS